MGGQRRLGRARMQCCRPPPDWAAGLLLAIGACSVLVPSADGRWISSFAGPYIAYAESFETCKDTPLHMHLRFSHFNPAKPMEKQIISGNLTIPSTVDDTWWVRSRLDVRSANQWKKNAFVFNFPSKCCSAMRENVPDGVRIMFADTVPRKGPCSVHSGFYEFDKKPINWTFPNLPVFQYGHYRFNIEVGKPGTNIVYCALVTSKFIPKPE